jgi:hypothetical protein
MMEEAKFEAKDTNAGEKSEGREAAVKGSIIEAVRDIRKKWNFYLR